MLRTFFDIFNPIFYCYVCIILLLHICIVMPILFYSSIHSFNLSFIHFHNIIFISLWENDLEKNRGKSLGISNACEYWTHILSIPNNFLNALRTVWELSNLWNWIISSKLLNLSQNSLGFVINLPDFISGGKSSESFLELFANFMSSRWKSWNFVENWFGNIICVQKHLINLYAIYHLTHRNIVAHYYRLFARLTLSMFYDLNLLIIRNQTKYLCCIFICSLVYFSCSVNIYIAEIKYLLPIYVCNQ